MNTLILVESKHHGNTRKLVDAIASKYDVNIIDVTEKKRINFEEYDRIGFASGIDFGKFYNNVTSYAEELPAGKRVFFIYTCANDGKDFSKDIRKRAETQGAIHMGTYGCKGFNTYGPWKIIGGMNKKHPNQDEIQGAVNFFKKMMREK